MANDNLDDRIESVVNDVLSKRTVAQPNFDTVLNELAKISATLTKIDQDISIGAAALGGVANVLPVISKTLSDNLPPAVLALEVLAQSVSEPPVVGIGVQLSDPKTH